MSDPAPTQGRFTVFLGMAAGVGKTYRMLEEGHAALDDGRDVAVGYLEPHGRAETLALAEGLETVPRRTITYRGSRLAEMDLPAILERAPELCLIDELAHTNAPGTEHAKRHEDVAAVLGAGVDVFTTVNVQHLESLNDQVAELTGTRVRETLPDSVLAAADDVVLIDLTPEGLRARLREGKVYPVERIEGALLNFFTLPNLAALREVALRQVAEEVEAKRTGPTRPRDAALPAAIAERLLALVTPEPRSQRVVRRAWRSAQRLGAELDVLWVSSHPPTAAESEQLSALRSLCTTLGAHLLVEPGDDVAAIASRVAGERGTTYVLMGTPNPRSTWRRLSEPGLPDRLIGGLPGVDLRIVADRGQRRTGAP